ncbi:MAG TPA: IS110 family transposase, partial [Vicinamibacteria bacterium]|nr:IS110 family transposase [Vicinamibacteria bacterium]
MDVLYPRCCGLDVHKDTVVACLVTPGGGPGPRKEVRTFGTTTEELRDLAGWLAAAECTHVAMESTGVYWHPVWDALEERVALLLVNARHVKAVPGRKTDVKDCEWLADLLRHGLLRGSAVPDRQRRELRELTRYRAALVRERAAHVNRLQKTLEGAGLKLASVASDVLGVSARAILAELAAGHDDPAALAELAKGRLRAKLPELRRALDGRFGAHHRFLVPEILGHIDDLDERLGRLDAEVAERLGPFEATVARLDAIPGVGRRAAEIILAELGRDLGHFPSVRHCASWAGLCPGSHESAGKRKGGKTRKGNSYLRATLIECALAAARKRESYLAAQYHRLVRRLGKKKAAVAVAHSLLVIIYHLLTSGAEYADLGGDYFARLDRDALERRHVRGLERLGFTVS